MTQSQPPGSPKPRRDDAGAKGDIYYHQLARAALDRMSPEVARRILRKVEHLRHDLAGDVKRLKKFVPNYRLRVGDWRVLFEVKGRAIIIHDLKHRSQAYDG